MATAAANIDATDNNGWTPLMVAAYHGHAEICHKLLELSANVDTKEQLFGWTPLLAAVWNNHKDVVNQLIRNNASISTLVVLSLFLGLSLRSVVLPQKSK